MRLEGVAVAAGDLLERSFECRVLEGLDLPAVVTDEVMVVLATGQRRLEPRDPVSQVDPLHESTSVEPFQGAVHAGQAEMNASVAYRIVDLLR